MRKTLPFLLLAGLPAIWWSCKSTKEELVPETPAAYFNLESGKYIIYRLDSMVFTNSGRSTEFHSYQERHLIDSLVTDGLGRPAWRVFRSIRNAAGSSPWRQAGTFLLTVSNAGFEWSEDNMRTLRLINPVREGVTWKGNRYLGSEPYAALYNFNNDDNIAEWDYTVSAVNEDLTVNGRPYSGVATVNLVNESILPDTVDVLNDSVRTPSASKLIWIRGNATGPITVVPPASPAQGRELSVYNFSNRPAVLNGIVTPVDRGRNYEFYNGSWTYLAGVDTVTQILPFGFRSYGREQYSRGVGLITQEYVLYEFQPNPNGTPYSIGFGVKRTILEHN